VSSKQVLNQRRLRLRIDLEQPIDFRRLAMSVMPRDKVLGRERVTPGLVITIDVRQCGDRNPMPVVGYAFAEWLDRRVSDPFGEFATVDPSEQFPNGHAERQREPESEPSLALAG
jgi:hypothetical protein